MELYRPRSWSIPRHLRQIPAHERFTVADAAQLKLQLQALDDKLEPDVDVETLNAACQSRPFHEEIYVQGSEEFYLLVKGMPRPDLIPRIYIEAFGTLQQGRFPINRYSVSDFRKGVDPTFSEVRPLLSRIDDICSTKLDESFRSLEDTVKPFPFLDLPAELRLHVYEQLLPREDHIAIMFQPASDHKPPRLTLDILRVNRRLHQEVLKHFYENRTLFMMAAQDEKSVNLSNEFINRYYETVAAMSVEARELFTKMEINITYLSDHDSTARKYRRILPVPDPLRQIFALLPNLSTVVLSPRSMAIAPMKWGSRLQGPETLEWLLDNIPHGLEVQWAGPNHSPLTQEEEKFRSVIARRGPFNPGSSVVNYRRYQCIKQRHDGGLRVHNLF